MHTLGMVTLALCMLCTSAHGQTLDWLQQYHGSPATQGVHDTHLWFDPLEQELFMATSVGGESWDPDGAALPIAGGSDILFQRFLPGSPWNWTLSTGGDCMEQERPTAMIYDDSAVTLFMGGVYRGNTSLGSYSITGDCEDANMFLATIGLQGDPTALKSVTGTSVTPTAMLINLDGALEVFGKSEGSPAVFRTSPLVSAPPGVFRAIYGGVILSLFSAERILRTGIISSAYRNGQYQVLTGDFTEADTLWGVPLEPGAPGSTGFVCKRLATSVGWIRTVGSSTYATTTMAAQLSGGDIVVAGHFQGDARFGSTMLEVGPEQVCGYLARYTTTGNLVWAKKVYGSQGFKLGKLVGDNSNGFYLAGSFAGQLSIGATSAPATTDRDFFVAHVNSSGVWDGIQQMGRVHDDQGMGLALDATGIYVAGNFDSTMVIGDEQFEPNQIGSTDLFVARFNGMEPVTSVEPVAEAGSEVLRIRANPTGGPCTLDLPTAIAVGSQLQVKVYDNLGQLVQQIPITVNEQRTAPVTIEAEAPGIYHVEVWNNGQRHAGTLVLDR